MIIIIGSSGVRAQFITNNDATVIGPQTFQLTPPINNMRGSVWYQYKADLTKPFNITGQMFFGKEGVGADGIVFVFQNYCLNAGSQGGGIGYSGLQGQSIGIEVDTYRNWSGGGGDQDNADPAYDHIAFIQQGVVKHDSSTNAVFPLPVQASPTSPSVQDSLWHDYKVDWNPTTKVLSMYFDDMVTPRQQITYDVVANVFTGNPFAYWGFTSATGGFHSPNKVKIDKLVNLTDYLQDATICRGDTISVSLPIYHDTLTNVADAKTYFASSDVADAHLAFDNNSASRWASDWNDNEFIVVDLHNNYRLNHIKLSWEAAYGSDYLIQVSKDSITWTTIVNKVGGVGGIEQYYTNNFLATPIGRYVRLQGVKRGSMYGYSLWDFRIYGESVYSWTPNTNISDAYSATPKFYPQTKTTYTYSMMDNCGITYKDSITIDIRGPITTLTPTNVSCNAKGDGQLLANVTTGKSPYNYQWSNGQTNATATNLLPQAYTLTVTDAQACSTVINYTITEPKVLAVALTHTDITCNSFTDGTITATPSDGTSPYTNYTWNNAKTTAIVNTLGVGNYTVTVKDSHGCTVTASQAISQPTPIILTLTPTNPKCAASNDGAITSSVSGGSSITYTYKWSNLFTDDKISGLGSGNFIVTVTDIAGCTKTANKTLTAPSAISINPTQTDVKCYNGNDGKISLAPSGGTAGYTYSWDNNTSLISASSLIAGPYTVTVTDANSCTNSATYNITAPPIINLTPVPTAASCNGSSDGKITLGVNGGNGGAYTYLWSNTAITQSITNLLAADYTVTVKDVKGCSQTSSLITVTGAGSIVFNPIATNVDCFGQLTGAIKLNSGGGTGTRTFVWNDALNSTTEDLSNIKAGNYIVTIKDANLCTVSTTVVISESPQLTATTASTPVSCNGKLDGKATVTPNGGALGYKYLWDDNSTANPLINQKGGTYNVTITDAKSCTLTKSIIITEATAITIPVMVPVNVKCFGDATGSLVVNPANGTPGYTYLWNDASNTTTASLSSIKAGTYVVTVKDKNLCTLTATATVSQPSLPLSATTAATDVSCKGYSDGSVSVSPSGGVSPYKYVWNGDASTTASLSAKAKGSYDVTITDFNNCTLAKTIAIIEPAQLVVNSIVPTPVLCNGNATGGISLSASGGTGILKYSWDDPSASNNQNLSSVKAGTYHVTITDAKNCPLTSFAIITEPKLLVAKVNYTPSDCSGANASITIDTTNGGGVQPFSFIWDYNNLTTKDLVGINSGDYKLTITDANGCKLNVSQSIISPTQLVASIAATPVKCAGDALGSIVVSVTPGTGSFPYTYAWDKLVATTATVNGLKSDTYTVTITDAKNCTSSKTATITQPDSLKLSVVSTPALCFGQTASATLTASKGTAPYSYSFNGTNTSGLFTNLPDGNYTPSVIDAHGCFVAATAIPIIIPTNLVTEANVTKDNCAEGKGAISFTTTGGVQPYTYKCTTLNTTGNPFTGLKVGDYTIHITDANNCLLSQTYTIVNKPCDLSIPNIFTPNGDEKNDYFTVKNLEQYDNATLTVFNRWGNELITIDNFNLTNHWDGYTSNGQLVSDGVYFIILKISDQQVMNSTLTVVK